MADVPTAPRLTKLGRKAIVQFEKEYDEYKRALENYNLGRPRNSVQNIKLWKDCIDKDLLDTLIEDEVLIVQVDDIVHHVQHGDESLEAALHTYFETFRTKDGYLSSVMRLKSDIQQLRMDMTESDPTARVCNFVVDLRRLIKTSGLNIQICHDPQQFGDIVKMLINHDGCLYPVAIRGWIRKSMDDNYRGKMTLKDFTLEVNKVSKALHDVKTFNDIAKDYGYSLGKSSRRDFGSKRHIAPKSFKANDSDTTKSGRETPVQTSSVVCWACSGDHHMRDCPKVTDSNERKRIAAAHRRKNANTKANASQYVENKMDIDVPLKCNLVESDSRHMLNQESNDDSVVLVKMAHAVEMQCLLDSGSDCSIISKSDLDIIKSKIDLHEFKLINPWEVRLADNEVSIHLEGIVHMDVSFDINGRELLVKDCAFYVSPASIDLPIIGNELLKSLGIDPKSNLQRLGGSQRMLDGLTDVDDYLEDDEDYVDIGTCDDEELRAALTDMIDRAKRSGLPQTCWTEMIELVSEFSSIFRVKLMNDPPANVTPMDVQLKPDYAHKLMGNRKYSDEEIKWLKNHINTLRIFKA